MALAIAGTLRQSSQPLDSLVPHFQQGLIHMSDVVIRQVLPNAG
jgi:hypothetical protein